MKERNNWLQNLKAGDAVIVRRYRHGHIGGTSYADAVVEKITPTGMIKVDGRLYKNGVARGDREYEIFSPDDRKIQEERKEHNI